MLKNLWITLPVSLFCALAQAANTVTIAQPAPSNTLAAPAAATSTAAAPEKKEEAPSVKYSMMFDTSYSMQAKQQPDGSRAEENSFTFMPGMSYGEYRASAVLIYSQDLADSAKSAGFYDPSFSLSKKSWKLGEYFSLGPSLSLALPMSDNSKNNVGLLYNIGGALSLSLNTKALGMDSWSISTSLGYNRNFTNYDTNASGSPNTAHRIRQRYNVGYQFTDKLSLSTRFQFDSSYTVNGVVKNAFLHYQTLGYDITDNISMSLGHANSNALLKADTYENNLKFFDDESSTYSVGVSVSL